MQSLKNYIFENCKLLAQHKTDEHEIERLKERVKDERENLMNLNAEYIRSLKQIREDNVNRSFG